MAGAFQNTAFQNDAFQVTPLHVVDHTITDTDILQLPVDCVLHGHQPYEFTKKDKPIPAQYSTGNRSKRSGVNKLEGEKPSFSTRSGSLGGAHKD